jgi:hypothetical protein
MPGEFSDEFHIGFLDNTIDTESETDRAAFLEYLEEAITIADLICVDRTVHHQKEGPSRTPHAETLKLSQRFRYVTKGNNVTYIRFMKTEDHSRKKPWAETIELAVAKSEDSDFFMPVAVMGHTGLTMRAQANNTPRDLNARWGRINDTEDFVSAMRFALSEITAQTEVV